MALILCSECGSQVSDKASVCPKCGAPIVVSKKEDTTKNRALTINWHGKSDIANSNMHLIVYGKEIATFNYRKDFSVEVPIISSPISIEVKQLGKRLKRTFELDVEKNYSLEILKEGFILYDEKGNELIKDNLKASLRIASFLLWPLGVIFWFFMRDDKPQAARSALYWGIYGLCFGLLIVFTSGNIRPFFGLLFYFISAFADLLFL